MGKHAFVAALFVAVASHSAMAQGGQFFVDGGIGRSSYSLWRGQDDSDKTDWATSIRTGYMWRGFVDYGVELGYADLGQDADRYIYYHNTGSDYVRYSTAVNGWLFGGRLEYMLGQSWFVMARGGWFRPRVVEERADWTLTTGGPIYTIPASGYSHEQYSVDTGTQTYFGVGIGYCLTQQWRVSLNYDYYDLGPLYSYKAYSEPSSHLKTYAVSMQYRF